MSVKDKALEYHRNGYNCAQSVLAACSEYAGLDDRTSLAISAGFGGGMRSGEICGAVSGGLMALGMAFPFNDAADLEAKNKISSLARKIVSACRDEYGAVRCIELKQSGVSCTETIGRMAEIVEEIIKNEEIK